MFLLSFVFFFLQSPLLSVMVYCSQTGGASILSPLLLFSGSQNIITILGGHASIN